MEPILEARGLGCAYGRRTVFSAIDLAVRPGEALALLGPNGAGKTTLLRALAGLLRPRQGEVRLDGAPLAAGRLQAAGDPADVLSPAVIQAAYGVPVLSVPHPLGGPPLLALPPGKG